MVMVRVPGGTFKMGSTEDEIDAAVEQCVKDGGGGCSRSWFEDESPTHTVTLDSFWIDQYEVTNEQYHKCVDAGACDAPTSCDFGEPTYEDASKADHPVVCVDWDGANTYCEWAEARLPTEAEWEYAARGSERRTYPWGEDEPICNPPRFRECSEATVPVGSFPEGASWCKALNMAGNVVEWVNDWYDGYPGTTYQSVDYGTQYKVHRGGSWFTYRTGVRSADRSRDPPSSSSNSFGFRCAADATP